LLTTSIRATYHERRCEEIDDDDCDDDDDEEEEEEDRNISDAGDVDNDDYD